MIVQGGAVSRVGWCSLAALAVLLTVWCIVSMASGEEDGDRLEALMERYAASRKQEKAADKPKPGEKGKPDGKKKPAGKSAKGKETKKGKKPAKKAKSPQDLLIERITKRHFFSPDPPRKKFSDKLMGVLGDTAYFHGGKEVKVGQKHKGATIKEIGPCWVKIEFEGKEQTVDVFQPGPGGPSKGGRPPMVRPGRSGRERGRPGRMPAGLEVTPAMVEKFKKLPPEMRKRALQGMPADMRKKIESQL